MTPFSVRLLCAVFFVSGGAALVFESLWFRQAGLAFGNSVWASTLVLSSFMAGLAAGNAFTVRFGPRIGRPVRFYAGLEATIAVTGALLVWLLPELGRWLAPVLGGLLEHPWLLNPVRFGLGFLLLLLPATAMGATLPILVKALSGLDANFGAVLGRLYGYNTLGAVAGALAAETVLVPWLGVRGSALAASALYLGVGAVALGIARSAAAAAPAPAPGPSGLGTGGSAGRAWLLALASFLAGWILLAFEVVWFRFIRLFIDPSSLAFSLMLAVVLSGIGAGGFAAGLVLRRRPGAFGHGAAVACLSGALAVALYAGFEHVLAPYGTRYIAEPRDVLWLSAALMLPVSLLSGVLFTFTGTALSREVAPDVQAVGWVALANTLGGMLGSFAGGFLLLPLLGVERSFFFLSALYAVVALLLLAARVEARSRMLPVLRWASALVLLGTLFAFPFGAMGERYLEIGVRRLGDPTQARIVAAKEGRAQTVVYVACEFPGEPLFHRLQTGAFNMASNEILARRYMKLFVYWPIALHPEARSALLISYGIGSTAKALTDTAGLERIDVVDISPEVLEMSSIAYPEDEHPLRDPRVHVHIEDGRYYLQTTGRRYDLITSEPPPPKHAGVVNLYTREYFQLIHDRLSHGGINTYWLPVNTLTLEDTRSIVRAYCDAFPDCSLWSGFGTSWMLVGSRARDWGATEEGFSAQWADPVVGPELRAVGVERPEQLGALFMADADGLRELTRDALPVTDDHPKRLGDDYPGRVDNRVYYRMMNTRTARAAFEKSDFIRRAWPPGLRERSLPYFAFQEMLNQHRAMWGGAFPIHRRIRNIHRVQTTSDLHTLVLWHLGIRDHATGEPSRSLPGQAGRALAARDFARAKSLYDRALRGSPRDRFLRYMRVYAACMAGELGDVADASPDSLVGRVVASGCTDFPEHPPEPPNPGGR